METSGQFNAPVSSPLEKESQLPTGKAGWAPEPVWMLGRREKPFASAMNQTMILWLPSLAIVALIPPCPESIRP
jgi:hypothetical protein